MEIQFEGEDEEGNPIQYATWQGLAEAAPWALIDIESLDDEKRGFLITELTPYVSFATIKNGDEVLKAPPSRFAKELDPFVQFANGNWTRLVANPNVIDLAESDAISFINSAVGPFRGLRSTYVEQASTDIGLIRQGKNWRTVQPSNAEPVACERLVDLYELDLAPRLTPLWHAVRILVHVERSKTAIDQGNSFLTVNSSFIVGTSHSALNAKITVAARGAKGGRQPDPRLDNRNVAIQALADEIHRKNPALEKTAVAVLIRKRMLAAGDTALSVRRITSLIKVGNQGS